MIALTQGLSEGLFSDRTKLKPLGIVTATVYYYVGENTSELKEIPRHLKINAVLERECPEATYVLNCKLEIYPAGHPDRPMRHCRITGDAYKDY